jgi:hypothetical protein
MRVGSRYGVSGERVPPSCHPCLRYLGRAACHLIFCRKRFVAKALPDPDLKYRSSLRAVTSSATAT